MRKQLITILVGLMILSFQAAFGAAMHADDRAVPDTATAVDVLGAQYQRLQAELQRYLALADTGGWPEVPDGPTIRPGAADSRLETLSRRLHISGDISQVDTSVSTFNYNTILQNAVRRFQARHGLEVDALVGEATLRALNVPIEKRIDQIRVNLDRLRQLIDDESGDLILVNIPAFKVYVIRDGKIIWAANVIVGDRENKTPIFRAVLTGVVFNPTWSVPHSIASKEMLPKIKQDPSFFRRGNYDLFDRDGNLVDPSSIDWSAVEKRTFAFTLVQQPGPLNELGEIKFTMPNEYSVCMHDTPTKSLFSRSTRAFSHGCIRLDEPLGFAEVILRSEKWTRKQIESQVEARRTRSVSLAEPLPVHVVYWTAEVDDLGVMHFYDDIYELDAAAFKVPDKLLNTSREEE